MTSKKIRICAFTGTRADYPRIKSVLLNLKKDKTFELKIVVTGSHLLKSAGSTYKEILDDKFKIDYKVKMFDDPPEKQNIVFQQQRRIPRSLLVALLPGSGRLEPPLAALGKGRAVLHADLVAAPGGFLALREPLYALPSAHNQLGS